jgi:hypothetical protein
MADVLALLRASPTFERIGKGRCTTWKLAGTEQEPRHEDASTQVVMELLRRLEAAEARLDALERRNGVHT